MLGDWQCELGLYAASTYSEKISGKWQRIEQNPHYISDTLKIFFNCLAQQQLTKSFAQAIFQSLEMLVDVYLIPIFDSLYVKTLEHRSFCF